MKPYYEHTGITIYHGDCLEIMPTLPAASVDLVLCDLPYGTTACKWDVVIPFDPLWREYWRVVRGAVVLTASQPFTAMLIGSQIEHFRYALVWEKEQATNFMFLKKQFGKVHEDIGVFYRSQPTYNPQKTLANAPTRSGSANKVQSHALFGGTPKESGSMDRYPGSILRFNRDRTKQHPTQKPVALMEYLIRTYTNPGDTVLDNCMGSGTTGVACVNTGRSFIGIEIEERYCEIAAKRLAQEVMAFA